jgi:hypothetical protein
MAKARDGGPSLRAAAWRGLPFRGYFNDEFTEVKVPLRVVPMPLTAAMITKAIPVAIKQYSMAVAPDSSLINLEKSRRIQKLLSTRHWLLPRQYPAEARSDWLTVD